MRYCQLTKWLYQWVEHASDASSIPLPNSAAIPLPADLLKLYQDVELHRSFDAIGRFFGAKNRSSLLSGRYDAGLTIRTRCEMRVFTMMPMRHWREAGRFAAVAAEAGFDAVMTAELAHDVFTPLAFAALATDRLELTPSIAVAFPRSPTVVASQAWDLQANSNGRFVLGLGSQVRG